MAGRAPLGSAIRIEVRARGPGDQGEAPSRNGAMSATLSPFGETTRTSQFPRTEVVVVLPVSVSTVRRAVLPPSCVAVNTVDQSVGIGTPGPAYRVAPVAASTEIRPVGERRTRRSAGPRARWTTC